MEHIHKINPAAGYYRGNRSRAMVKRKDNVLPLSIDNFSLKKLGDKINDAAGKVVKALGGDSRSLIKRAPDVAKATVNTIAAPITTLGGKTVFGAGQFDNKSAANALNSTLKVAGPIATGAIVASAVSQLAKNSPNTANILNKALTTTPAAAAAAAATMPSVSQPVSTSPETLPKTQASVNAEKIAALNVNEQSIGDTIKSNPLILYGIIGFVVLIFLIVIIKLK